MGDECISPLLGERIALNRWESFSFSPAKRFFYPINSRPSEPCVYNLMSLPACLPACCSFEFSGRSSWIKCDHSLCPQKLLWHERVVIPSSRLLIISISFSFSRVFLSRVEIFQISTSIFPLYWNRSFSNGKIDFCGYTVYIYIYKFLETGFLIYIEWWFGSVDKNILYRSLQRL